MNSKVLSYVNKLEGYKTAIKQLHWGAKNLSQHKLCDDIASKISDFQDQVSEVEQSISGKFKFNKLKPTPYKIMDLKKFVKDVIASANSFYKSLPNSDDYIGMKSDCESFLSDMQRQLYLVNFTINENMIKRVVNESIKNFFKNELI